MPPPKPPNNGVPREGDEGTRSAVQPGTQHQHIFSKGFLFSLRFSTGSTQSSCGLSISDADAHIGQSLDEPHHGHTTTPQDSKESSAIHRSKEKAGMRGLTGGTPEKHHALGTEGMSSSGGSRIQAARINPKLQAPRVKKHTKSNTSLSWEKSLRTSQQPRTKIVHVGKPNEILNETRRVIQQLNKHGLGEDISDAEFRDYLRQLPSRPSYNTGITLEDEQLDTLAVHHAVCRLKYIQWWSKQVPKNKQHDDEVILFDGFEEDGYKMKDPLDFLKNFHCSTEEATKDFLKEQGYFLHFEKDGIFDWSFYPDYCMLASLNDYQRIVLRNDFGMKYFNWDDYHQYFHSYETELEYLEYCKVLSEKLKWIEDYVPIDRTSLKGRSIFDRGFYQAIKIATGFSKITVVLAYIGYEEVVKNLSYDVTTLRGLDGIYFEIWQRITKLKMCFRDALDEVYKLNKFPLRQPRMKRALDTDCSNCSEMEKEFRACIEGISEEVTDDEAQEWIAEAVLTHWEKPKLYEDYIRKKIDIARICGVIPGKAT